LRRRRPSPWRGRRRQAALSDVKVGDSVFVHVYPASGAMLVERLFDGDLPSGGPGVGPLILPAQT
jgi:hypothetical protein